MSDRWSPAGFKDRIDSLLTGCLAEEAEHLLAIDDTLKPVADQLQVAARHGKRLRAAFCYWGWRAAGQPDSEALVRAAASMELVHAAAIVHDDLIDDSPLRHNLPTAHIALRAAVNGRPQAGTAARSLAVLVGDHLMALAGQLFATSGLPAAYLARARPMWGELARELIAGECLEILHTGTRPDTDVSLKVVRYKTAKYTVEQQLKRVLPRRRHRLGSSHETHLTLCQHLPHLGGSSKGGRWLWLSFEQCRLCPDWGVLEAQDEGRQQMGQHREVDLDRRIPQCPELALEVGGGRA